MPYQERSSTLTADFPYTEPLKRPNLEPRPTSVSKKQWWLLPGTGYDVRGQINELIRAGDIEMFIEKTEQNIKHFVLEYPLQRLAFPIFLNIEDRNGQNRLTAPRYGNEIYEDLISEQERAGSVKRSVKQIEDFLIHAPIGSMAVLVSPPGWSGLDDRQGGQIVLLDNQIYILKKTQKGVEGRTIRTDLSLEESEEFLERLESLAVDPKTLQTKEDRIINVVSSPAFFTYSEDENTFEAVVNLIKKVKRSNFAYQGRGFAEIYEDLSLGEKLLDENKQINQFVIPLLFQFRSFVLREGEVLTGQVLDRIEAELGKTILRIYQAIKIGNPQKEAVERLAYVSDEQLQRAHVELMQLPGCNGGGSVMIGTSLGVREAAIIYGSDEYGSRVFSCPSCGRTNVRPEGQLLSNCQHCGSSKVAC